MRRFCMVSYKAHSYHVPEKRMPSYVNQGGRSASPSLQRVATTAAMAAASRVEPDAKRRRLSSKSPAPVPLPLAWSRASVVASALQNEVPDDTLGNLRESVKRKHIHWTHVRTHSPDHWTHVRTHVELVRLVRAPFACRLLVPHVW